MRDIVVHQNQDPRREANLQVALALGQAHGARVTGIFSLYYPVMPVGTMYADVGAELYEQQYNEQRRVAEGIEKTFNKRLKDEGVHGEWRLMDGDPVGAMTLCARYADLAVVGQANPDAPGINDRMAPELVLAAGRPVLVVPYVGTQAGFGRRIMLAWNGSREATRAAHDALPFLRKAEQVIAFCVNPSEDQHIPGADIAAHLSRHGVRVEPRHVVASDLDVGDALLSAVADHSADMLVMGGYGHSRFRELVLGGATRQILRSMTVPVLLSH